MKKSLRSKYVIKKNRLKGRSADLIRDYLKASALLFVVTALTALLICGYSCVVSSPVFLIKNTLVSGCRELTEKEVLQLAALKPSQTLLSVNLEAMARRIAAQPWVRNVAISREFPHRLIVEIQERRVLALSKQNDDFYLMDHDGTLFKKLENGDAVDAPVLTGCFHQGYLDQALFDKSLHLMKILAASKTFPMLSSVAEINGDPILGFSLYTENGFCLKLGFDDYQDKLKRLPTIITALNRKEMNQGLLNIDLRDLDKIYVEKRSSEGPVEKLKNKKGVST